MLDLSASARDTRRFYGDEPSLTHLDDGDLKAGLDFRSVHASLLSSVLGAEPGRAAGRLGPPGGRPLRLSEPPERARWVRASGEWVGQSGRASRNRAPVLPGRGWRHRT